MDMIHMEARVHAAASELSGEFVRELLKEAVTRLRAHRDPAFALATMLGAFRYLEWAAVHRNAALAFDHILSGKNNLIGWMPAPATGAELATWRESEGLTQAIARRISGVDLRTWQRWEENGAPQWLGDVLERRWGPAPVHP